MIEFILGTIALQLGFIGWYLREILERLEENDEEGGAE
jgi:hypothetical protein